jgi:formamidopyrimidine-DNA glycosylase
MPELPDVTVYVEHLERRLAGRRLDGVRVRGLNLLRTAVPPLDHAHGRVVRAVSRMGKRIVFALDGGLFLVLHLMIAGRLHWKAPGAALPSRVGLAAFDFEHGSLTLTEAGTKQRAALHLLAGDAGLRALDPGGLEVFAATREEFRERLRREDHTIKRALTDPRLLSGVGNSYSDEILHRAKLSPFKRTPQMSDDEWTRLFDATRQVLAEWTERLRAAAGDPFPEGVTAFRDGMAVHGRHRQPCPVCGTPVQRIAYAERETHYCPTCQTGGRLLADRGLSRLLRDDWPRTIEELEEGRARRASARSRPGTRGRA